MPIFIYKARDQLGRPIVGQLNCENAMLAKLELKKQGLYPISVETKSSELSLKKILNFGSNRKFKTKDLANLTRQFEVLFTVGTPMERILSTLAQQAQHEGIKEALTMIHKDITGGMRIAEAFGRHPTYFSPLYTSMLEMGQAGGVLSQTLKEMAAILQKEHIITSKVKGALLYPEIVLVTLAAVSCMMLVFVFPPFKAFYAGHNAQLPLPTKIVIAMSDVIMNYWYIPVACFIAGFFAWTHFKKTPAGRLWISKAAFALPIFGRLNLLVANSRFGHLVSALYRSGLPLPLSLKVVADTMTNVCYAAEIRDLKTGLEHGRSMSQCMEKSRYFSAMVKEACAVGEQTGKLDVVLESTASFYDGEVDDLLANLTTLIEPIMLFFLFGAVMLLALAVYLPIWNLSRVVLH